MKNPRLLELKRRFPWLGTENAVAGSDVVEQVNDWFAGLGGETTLKECIASGEHLRSVDRDGFCNNCGEQDSPVPEATIVGEALNPNPECSGSVLHYDASQTVGDDEVVRLCTAHAEARGYGVDQYIGSAADNAVCDESGIAIPLPTQPTKTKKEFQKCAAVESL